ncbi:MAG: tetratricopeptide repeat protein [Arenimonas sp.]
MSFFDELKRRKVFKIGVGYLVVAWLVVQVASIAFPAFDAPAWALRIFILVLLLGFPISLLFAWAFEVTPEGLKADAASAGNKRFLLVAATLAALAFAWYFKGQPAIRDAIDGSPAVTVPATAAAPAAGVSIDPRSIAVLPFVDMSQGKDQEYFSDGLSEELLNLLAQLPQLKVIARTSSFSFKGKEADVATIARALKVANVLEGSVRKSGNTLRITAQLIRTSDSTHLWSQTYDRELTDVFKVQDEIATAVVAALKVSLLPDQSMSNAHRSSNAEAYNQLLLGNSFNDGGNPEDWRLAAAAFRKAIALDPGYAAAYAGLATSEAQLGDSTGDAATKQQALADANKAIMLGPEISDGYIVRGTVRLSFNRDWAGARADYERALALEPGRSAVQASYGRLLIALGRVPEAIAVSRRAIELDPLAPGGWSQLGRMLNAVGQFNAARDALDRSLEIGAESNGTLFHRGMNELLQGRAQAALPYFRKAGSGYGGAGRAMAEHSLGNSEAAKRELDAEIAGFSQGAAYQIAEIYAWRGESDQAFEWLERAYAQNDGGLTFIKADPLMKSIEGDRRFATLLRKMGLPE